MATRTLDGPEQDWLDIADLVRITRLSETTIRRMIKAGRFPAPFAISPQGRMWSWEVVIWWRMTVQFGLNTEGQQGPTTGQLGPSDEESA